MNRPSRDIGRARDRDRLSRRALLGAMATGLGASATPAAAVSTNATDGTLTEAALEAASYRLLGSPLPDLYNAHSKPTWAVEYAEGERGQLDEWLAGGDRDLVDDHPASNTAYVAATTDDIGAHGLSRVFGEGVASAGGLASRSYTESIDAVPVVSLPDPVDLEPESEAWPDYGIRDTYLTYDGDPPTSAGVAFDDVNTAPMQTAAAAVSADSWTTKTPTIAVVDSGLNTAGGDVFGGSNVTGAVTGTRILEASKNQLTGETVANNSLDVLDDGNGHGTFVAAQVAGDPAESTHAGILPSARLLAIRALADDGKGSTMDIAQAIRYAADQGVDAIVCSLGSPAWSHDLDRAAAYANGAGSIVVAAAGNDRMGTRWISSPASSSRILGVASTTAQTTAADVESSYFSNVGPHPGTTDLSGTESADASPDVAAPGHRIETTVPTQRSDTETAEKSGTSMSAPIVGAVVAALVDSESALAGDVDGVRTRLQDAALRVEQCAAAEVGAGVVDGDAALSGTVRDTSQEATQTSDAETRDDAYRTESESRGRTIAGWL